MTATLIALSAQGDDAERADFWLQFFVECAPELREAEFAPFAPSAQYTRLVLKLMPVAACELFLLLEEGRVRGRAAVSALKATPGAAGISLFECGPGVNRDANTGMLIDAACRWANDHGCPEIYAPVDLNSWFSYRFLLPPAPHATLGRLYAWEPVQPLEHVAAFVRRGFQEAERYHTLIGEFDESARAALSAMPTPAASRAQADGYVFEQLTEPAGLPALLREAHGVCMDAFAGTLLFAPIDAELFVGILLAGASTRDCTLTHWVRDGSGRMAGFALAFVDDGAAVVKSVAIAPEARGRHLSTALTQLVVKTALARGHTTFISALIRSGNTSEFLLSPYIPRGTNVMKHEYVLLRRPSRFT
jgi:hypothetical protein